MPIETMLGGLIIIAIITAAVVIVMAGKMEDEKVVEHLPVATATNKVQEAPEMFYAQKLQDEVKSLQEKLQEARELGSVNDALRYEVHSVKKDNIELTERYRDVLAKFDSYKQSADAQIAGLIKEKEIAFQQAQEQTVESAQQLGQEVQDLRRTNEKLKDLNNTLSVKTDMLQYELIKSRAQSTGFERISQNYRKQLEGLMSQLQGVNENNVQLNAYKNRLESMLNEIKNEHEDLTRREKLAQFELSKRQEDS